MLPDASIGEPFGLGPPHKLYRRMHEKLDLKNRPVTAADDRLACTSVSSA